MKRKRNVFRISVLEDSVPGWNGPGRSVQDMQHYLERMLAEMIPHYQPRIEYVETTLAQSSGQKWLYN